ncbi:MAG TPA: ATP-binding protein [Bryobacteraceae bacterium]
MTVPPGEAQETETLARSAAPSASLQTLLELTTRLASELTSTPMAMIAVMDGERGWKISAKGMEPPEAALPSAVMAEGSAFTVADAREDLRFASYLPVTGESAVRAIAGVPLFTEDGLPLGFLCVMERQVRRFRPDELGILERVAAAAAKQFPLRNAQAARAPQPDAVAWKKAISSAALGVAILDREGRFVEVNPSCCRITGYGREEMAGRTIADLLPPGAQGVAGLAAEIALECDGVPEAGLIYPPAEFRIVRKDGTHADVRFSVGRFFQDAMSLRVVTMEDVTVLKREDAQLRSAERLDAVSRLAAGVAHGFNNLLTIITGYGQLLQDDLAGNRPAQDYLEEISRAAGAAALLTTKLLAFGWRRMGEVERLDLGALTRETAALARAELPARIQLITEPAAGQLPVLADRGYLAQALRELLANACEAMPQGGSIRIRTAKLELSGQSAPADGPSPGRYVLLQVEDEGEGMDPEAQKHLFEPFYSTKAVGRGTGLAMVYGAMRQCGGEVKVSSHPGRGTVVTLFLPLA